MSFRIRRRRSASLAAMGLAAMLAGAIAAASIVAAAEAAPAEAAPAEAALRAARAEKPEAAQPDEQGLPWKRAAEQRPEPPTRRLSSAREMLELFNVDDSQLRRFADGRPLDVDEDETLWKILYRMPQFGIDKLEAWQRKGIAWSEVAANPEEHRIQVFGVEGRVRRIERVELPPEAALRLEFDHYYHVEFALQGGQHPAHVYCRQIPKAWHNVSSIDERARCLGLLLKIGDRSQPAPPLYFAADRIAWLPDRVAPGVDQDMVLLGDLGMDAGLWDQVRQTNGRGLVREDHEAFYQLLAAVDRAPARTLFDRASREFDLAALLNKPAEAQGQLMSFAGRARRVQKIRIEELSIRERFGIDHYYQIDMLVPLEDEMVRIVTKAGKGDGPVFRNSYPVHCCVLRLPKGLPDRPDVNEEIRVAGFYFKLWAYSTQYVETFGQDQRQLGPLFLTAPPRLIVRAPGSSRLADWLGGAAFLAVLAGIALAAWLYRRSDRRFNEQFRKRRKSSFQEEQLP